MSSEPFFEVENDGDPALVDPEIRELPDSTQAPQVARAVTAGAFRGAPRTDETSRFVHSQGLRMQAAFLRCDGDQNPPLLHTQNVRSVWTAPPDFLSESRWLRHTASTVVLMSALYSTFRPTSFQRVAGQNETIAAVAGAVRAGTPHHAYLFTGPRGTGKTTTARLIAAGLNCEHGPTDTPCGRCYNCETIRSGTAMDVQEIDAATHNRVDDIRALREKISTVPAFGAWRVYILDEVHMLSNSAWNAFLKTLEEPPAQTLFVLCTTEPRRVPATVRSRCQHYAFRPGTTTDIAGLLTDVAQEAGWELAEPAAVMLARAARGSYRDGLSLLDRAITSARAHTEADRQRIDEHTTRRMLASQSEERVLSLLRAIAAGERQTALANASTLAAEADAEQLIRELEALSRELLICAVYERVPASLRTSSERDMEIRTLAADLGAAGICRVIDELTQALVAIRAGADERLRFELACLRSADPSLRTIDEQVAQRLDRIEATVMAAYRSRRPTA
jgi:DNA polymerase-3 subunit gamma/tau